MHPEKILWFTRLLTSYGIMPQVSCWTVDCCLVMSLACKPSPSVVRYLIMSVSSALILQHRVGTPGASPKDGWDWSSGSRGRQDLAHTAPLRAAWALQ